MSSHASSAVDGVEDDDDYDSSGAAIASPIIPSLRMRLFVQGGTRREGLVDMFSQKVCSLLPDCAKFVCNNCWMLVGVRHVLSREGSDVSKFVSTVGTMRG